MGCLRLKAKGERIKEKGKRIEAAKFGSWG